MPSVSKEDYLRAMHHLAVEHDRQIKSIEIADYLNVSRASVSEMLRRLEEGGFIRHERYSKTKFTSKGRRLAEKLTAKHRLIERFLADVLRMRPEHIHEQDHKLEHAFSDEAMKQIRKLLHDPKTDPHGQPIPLISIP